jgi:hypothetical protein
MIPLKIVSHGLPVRSRRIDVVVPHQKSCVSLSFKARAAEFQKQNLSVFDGHDTFGNC